MLKFLFFIFPAFVFGQSSLSKQDEAKLYTQAIAEYIKAVNTTDKLTFDSLFVGPVDPEYIQNVVLPKEILKVKIAKLTEEEGRRKVEYHKTFVFANIVGTISKDHAKFMFITFIVEKGTEKTQWLPKHNFEVDFSYDSQSKSYKFEKQKIDYSYSNKYTKDQSKR